MKHSLRDLLKARIRSSVKSIENHVYLFLNRKDSLALRIQASKADVVHVIGNFEGSEWKAPRKCIYDSRTKIYKAFVVDKRKGLQFKFIING